MLTDRLTGRGTRWVLALLLCLLAAVSAAQTTDPLEASRALARNAERYQALGKYQPAVDQPTAQTLGGFFEIQPGDPAFQ